MMRLMLPMTAVIAGIDNQPKHASDRSFPFFALLCPTKQKEIRHNAHAKCYER